MPKETIVGSAVGTGGYHVKVGWANDQEVQVGVAADAGHSLFWMLLGVAVTDNVRDPATSDDVGMSEKARDRHHRRLAEVGSYIRATVATATGVELVSESEDDPGNLTMDAAIARGVLNNLDTLTHGQCSSVWSDLDRAGCNRLILIVRRARDAAYGRDE